MKALEEIMEGMFQEGQLKTVQLEIDALSYPAASKVNGRQVEKFFIYSNQPRPIKSRPYAWCVVDSESGTLLSYSRCEYCDFAQDTGTEPGEEIDYSASMKGSFAEIAAAKQRFCELYGRIREFAFCGEPDSRQKELLTEYLDLHGKLFREKLGRMYRELAPDFYSWMERAVSL